MSKKILIADDDPVVVKLLTRVLETDNYDVMAARDGLDVLVLVKRDVPDLIILDVMMPEINGYDVCLELKFDDLYKHIPIILLTVRDRELNKEIGKRAGIEYIKKPIEPDVILETVKTMLTQ